MSSFVHGPKIVNIASIAGKFNWNSSNLKSTKSVDGS